MFKCQSCNTQSKAGEGQTKLVTEWKTRSYENVVKQGKKTAVVKSGGRETVKEISVCSGCAHCIIKPLE